MMDASDSSSPRPWRLSANAGSSAVKLRRILVPVDLRRPAGEVLRYAAAFARDYKAKITVLHVVQPDGSHVRRNISRERLIDELIEASELQLRKLVEVLWGDDIATEIVVASGKMHVQIVNEARETNADMIIMVNDELPGACGIFRRTTVTRVMREAPCPVLVVQPCGPGFAVNGVVRSFSDR